MRKALAAIMFRARRILAYNKLLFVGSGLDTPEKKAAFAYEWFPGEWVWLDIYTVFAHSRDRAMAARRAKRFEPLGQLGCVEIGPENQGN